MIQFDKALRGGTSLSKALPGATPPRSTSAAKSKARASVEEDAAASATDSRGKIKEAIATRYTAAA